MIAEVGGPIDDHYASLTTQGVVDWEFQNRFSFASILYALTDTSETPRYGIS